MGCGSSKNFGTREAKGHDRENKKDKNEKNNVKNKWRLSNGGIAPYVPEAEVAEQYRKTIYNLRKQAITQGLMEDNYEWCGKSDEESSNVSTHINYFSPTIECNRNELKKFGKEEEEEYESDESTSLNSGGIEIRIEQNKVLRIEHHSSVHRGVAEKHVTECEEKKEEQEEEQQHHEQKCVLNRNEERNNEALRRRKSNGDNAECLDVRENTQHKKDDKKITEIQNTKNEFTGQQNSKVKDKNAKNESRKVEVNAQSLLERGKDRQTKEKRPQKKFDHFFRRNKMNTNSDTSSTIHTTSVNSMNNNNDSKIKGYFWPEEVVAEKEQTHFFRHTLWHRKNHKKSQKECVGGTYGVQLSKEELLTIFLCRPLLNEPVIGKGMYSDVYLADMTVIPAVRPSLVQHVLTSITQAECMQNVNDDEMESHSQKCHLYNSCEQQTEKHQLEEHVHEENMEPRKISINNNEHCQGARRDTEETKRQDTVIQHIYNNNNNNNNKNNNKNNNNNSNINNYNNEANAMFDLTSESCPPHRHYLICVKEFALHSYQEKPEFIKDVVEELSEWQRLNTFNNRLLRCIGAEVVNEENITLTKAIQRNSYLVKPDEHSPQSSSSLHSSTRFKEEDNYTTNINTNINTTNNKDDDKTSQEKSMHKNNTAARLSSKICKLRVYIEFAKHGTLRSFQTREIPKRFNKTYLHELTARALMREVLLGLLQVHENFALQYDLNASNVYLTHPMQTVYKTLFPAYISDIPVGSLLKVSPQYLRNLLLQQRRSTLGNVEIAQRRNKLTRLTRQKNRSEVAVAPLNRSSLGSGLPEDDGDNNNNINNNNEHELCKTDNALAATTAHNANDKDVTFGLTEESRNISAMQIHESSLAMLDAKDNTVFDSTTEFGSSSLFISNSITTNATTTNNNNNNNNMEEDLVSQNTSLNEDDDVFWQSAHARKYFTEHGYESDSLFVQSMHNEWPSASPSETKMYKRTTHSSQRRKNKLANESSSGYKFLHDNREKVISLKLANSPEPYSLEFMLSPSASPSALSSPRTRTRKSSHLPFFSKLHKNKLATKADEVLMEHHITNNKNNNNGQTHDSKSKIHDGVVFIASQRLPSYFVAQPATNNTNNNNNNNINKVSTIGNASRPYHTEQSEIEVANKTTSQAISSSPLQESVHDISNNKRSVNKNTANDLQSREDAIIDLSLQYNTPHITKKLRSEEEEEQQQEHEEALLEMEEELRHQQELVMQPSREHSTHQFSRRGSKSGCISQGISRCNEHCSLPSFLPLLLENTVSELDRKHSIVAGNLVQSIIESSKVTTSTLNRAKQQVPQLNERAHPALIKDATPHQNHFINKNVAAPHSKIAKEGAITTNTKPTVNNNNNVATANKESKFKEKEEKNLPNKEHLHEPIRTTEWEQIQQTKRECHAPTTTDLPFVESPELAGSARGAGVATAKPELALPMLEPETSEVLLEAEEKEALRFNSSIITGIWRANEHSSSCGNVHYRHRHPVVKLNYTTLLQRVLARQQNAWDSNSVPLHRFIRITHAAPEVILQRKFSQASDVYAFAMMFIELCTANGRILPECEPHFEFESFPNLNNTVNGTVHVHSTDSVAHESNLHENAYSSKPPRGYAMRKEYDALHAANVKKWYKTQLKEYRERQKGAKESSVNTVNSNKSSNVANTFNTTVTSNVLDDSKSKKISDSSGMMVSAPYYVKRDEDSFGRKFNFSAYIRDPDKPITNDVSINNYGSSSGSNLINDLSKRGSGASFSGWADDTLEWDYMQHCLVPIPSHLSYECRRLLAQCLHVDPSKRPSVAELLRSPYFLFGHWIQHDADEIDTVTTTTAVNNNNTNLCSCATSVEPVMNCTTSTNTISWSTSPADLAGRQMPEIPWNGEVNYARLGGVAGLPVIPKYNKPRKRQMSYLH